MRNWCTRSLVTLGLAAAAPVGAADSPLGSSAEAAGRFSDRYAEVVRAALPRVDAAELAKLMERVKAAAAEEKPLAVGNAQELEKFFSFRARGRARTTDFVDVGDAVYRLDPASGRIYVAWRTGDLKPVSREAFAPQLKEIRSTHEALTRRLGIPPQEIMFTDFREILSETDGHPVLQNGVIGKIQSEGATTTLLRAVGGVLVEGSYLRMSSANAKTYWLVDARWPALRLADGALRGLRSPQDVLEAIVNRVTTNAGGVPVSVLMAVVLRPVDPAKPTEFVPTLKIGVRPKSVKTKDGYRTDAGEIYYSDLVRDSPPFVDPPAKDTGQSEP
jgi:hypothetical protein